MEKNWRDYINYIIIALVSLVALFVIPFIGSEVGLSLVLPTTTAGWIVFVITKLIICVINVVIFHCFICQAKINIKDHPRFVEAQRLLHEIEDKTVKVKSPREYFRKMYLTKGATLIITTTLSAFSLGLAVLVFDLLTFISYAITIFLGLVFGILNMKTVEEYWTEDFLIYAHQQVEEAKKRKTTPPENNIKQETTNDNNK